MFNDTAQKQGKAATSSINAMQAHAKAANLLADAENVLAGKATKTTKLMSDQGTAFDKTAQKAGGAAAGLAGVAGTGGAGGGAAAGSGMAAVIAAGVALSPVLITVGTGLAGLAAAAYGIAKPITTAAGATGGLAANLKTLNPEQRQVAAGLLGLQRQFAGFEKVLQPAVFVLFNDGIRLAGTLLHSVEPVATATGKALGGVLSAVDKEFRSGTWQQFFAFMARTAGPDVRLLGTTFVSVLDALPPLVQGLQPVAVGLLHVAAAATQVTDVLTHAPSLIGDTTDALIQLQNHQLGTAKSTDTMGVAMNQAALRTQGLGNIVYIADQTFHGAGAAFKFLTGQTVPAAAGIKKVGDAAAWTGPKLVTVNATIGALSLGWQSANVHAAPLTDQITRMATAGNAAFRAAGPVTDQITRLGTSSRIAAGHVAPLTDQITMAAAAEERAAVKAGPLTDQITNLAIPAKAAAGKLADIGREIASITTAEGKALGPMTGYNDALIGQYNSAKTLNAALRTSHDQIGLNTQKQRDSFSAADAYINQTITAAKAAGTNSSKINDVITSLHNELPKLQGAQGGTRAYWQEVKTLVGWLDTLKNLKAIHEAIFVSGNGTFTVKAGTKLGLPGGTAGGPFAAGGVVRGGVPGKDSVLISAMPGEVVVPTHMVAGGAVDHLRGKIPGFATGGIIPSYAGPVPGVQPWGTHNLNATVRIFEQATANATAAAMKAAAAAAARAASAAARGSGGPASGAVNALQRYAASLFGQFGWGASQLGPLIALWNGESGWNPNARNPSSGAYGIPQALPPSKMGALAASGNAAAQIRWGEGYIHSVYGTPGNAYSTWLSRSPHWYDRGGWLPPGVSMAVNATGRPERVVGPGEGTRLQIEWVGGNAGDGLLNWIQKNVRIRGGGSVQKAFGRP